MVMVMVGKVALRLALEESDQMQRVRVKDQHGHGVEPGRGLVCPVNLKNTKISLEHCF